MTTQDFGTLAYTKSPKTWKRTNFQDELQAAVSARARKSTPEQGLYSDAFSEDEDDLLSDYFKSMKKKTSTFKGGKSKTKINDFEISDDESKLGRTKRVSFLRSQRISLPSEDDAASESPDNKLPDPSVSPHIDDNHSFSSQYSQDDTQFKDSTGESNDPQSTRESRNKPLSYQASEDPALATPLSLPCDSHVVEHPGPGVTRNSSQDECSHHPLGTAADPQHVSSADSATETEPPRPKPRQRSPGLNQYVRETVAEDAEPQDLSRGSQSPSAAIDTSHNIALADRDVAVTRSLVTSSCQSEQLQLFTKSVTDPASGDGFTSNDRKQQERKDSASFEELNQSIGGDSDQASRGHKKTFDSRSICSMTSKRSQNACYRNVESKYLGSLKLLDVKVSPSESQPQTADSLRATIYQNWLQKKKEKSKENILKKKQEMLKESKIKAEDTKKEEAAAAFEAWKEKKDDSLKAKAKEKRSMVRKEQSAIEEMERKRESAEKVFEQWKRQHDRLLKEKYKKQREAESKLLFTKQEKEAERMSESKSAFSNWYETKTDVLRQKVTKERKAVRSKAEEEEYMKEEKDRMALEVYEKWLTRKHLEWTIQREERRIQAVLRVSPPPPWSPPNKTIPFQKTTFKR